MSHTRLAACGSIGGAARDWALRAVPGGGIWALEQAGFAHNHDPGTFFNVCQVKSFLYDSNRKIVLDKGFIMLYSQNRPIHTHTTPIAGVCVCMWRGRGGVRPPKGDHTPEHITPTRRHPFATLFSLSPCLTHTQK